VASVAIVETRYAVPGWGFGELWRRDDVVLAHDFHFGPVSDTVSDTGPKWKSCARTTSPRRHSSPNPQPGTA